MKYRYAALFAAAVAAAPLPQDGLLDTGDIALNGGGAGGGGNVILRRAEDGLIGNVGVGVSALGKGDATGVKNAKRGGVTDDIGAGVVALGDGDGTGVKNAKRSDAGLDSGILGDDQNSNDADILGILRRSQDGGVTDDIGVGAVALGDGDGTGVKNAKRGGVTDDIGVGVVALGDGDATGVKNAKRSEEDIINLGGGGHYSYDAYDDGALLDVLKRSQDGGVTDDIGVGVVALGDGDGTGVKNAKRDLIGVGDDILGNDDYYDDGDALDILRRSQDGAITDDIGVGAVVGNGDGTGVKNAKRDLQDLAENEGEDLIGDIGIGARVLGQGDADGVKNGKKDDSLLGDVDLGLKVLSDGELVGTSKRSEHGSITDNIGVGAVVGNGDSTGVKNAKRFEIGDIDVGSTGVGRTDSGLPILDPDL